MPGGTVSSSAEMRSTPRSASRSPSQLLHGVPVALHLLLGLHLLAEEVVADGRGLAAELGLERVGQAVRRIGGEHDVRSPAAAQRRAVAAATLVLPTPPLPV